MLRWIKCLLKLFGRGCLIAFLIWLLYWGFYWFWMCCMNLKEVATAALIIACILIAVGLFAAALAGIAKYIKWSCTPPLLDPKKKK